MVEIEEAEGRITAVVAKSEEIRDLLEREVDGLEYVDYFVFDMEGYVLEDGQICIDSYESVFKFYGTYTDQIRVARGVNRELAAEEIFEEACDASERVYNYLYELMSKELGA
jgi:hypothetical protein